jgi:hypothetical protein
MLPGIQALPRAAEGRWLGGNRRNSSQLVAPAASGQRPCEPTHCSGTVACRLAHLTERLIKVIKHDHFPAFLRYNLPPIIRTSPDRASQHRQCACIDNPRTAHREPPTQIE